MLGDAIAKRRNLQEITDNSVLCFSASKLHLCLTEKLKLKMLAAFLEIGLRGGFTFFGKYAQGLQF